MSSKINDSTMRARRDRSRRRLVAISLAGLVCLPLGCQSVLELPEWPPSLLAGDPEPKLPDRMMVIWSDTVLHQPQQPGVRGFGGRIYFYQGNDPKPVVVDGGLAVYAFNAEVLVDASTQPERKFLFTADQFAEHMSHSEMGPSYSVWIPWDEVGGVSRQLSLVTRFEGRDGGVVISDPAIELLPGVTPPRLPSHAVQAGADAATRSSLVTANGIGGAGSGESVVRQSGYLGPTETWPSGGRAAGERAAAPEGRSESLTINLPPSFARHLRRSDGESASGESAVAAPRVAERSSGPVVEPAVAPADEGSESPRPRQPRRADWIHDLPPTPRRDF